MIAYQLMPVDKWRKPSPHAEAISIRFSWRDGFDTLGKYTSWCSENDVPYLIHPMAGRHSIDVGRWMYVEGRQHQEPTSVPIPWRREYRQTLHRWLRNIASTLSGDPLWHGWHMPGFRDSSELHIPPEFKTLPKWEDKLVMCIRQRLQVMRGAASNRLLIVDYSHIHEVADRFLDVCRQNGVALQHNALRDFSNRAWVVHRTVSDWTPHGFQTVGEVGRAGDSETVFAIAKSTGAKWLELYSKQIKAWSEHEPDITAE